MITEIIEIDETPNLQGNSDISCPISKVLQSIYYKCNVPNYCFLCYRDLYRQLTSMVKCFSLSIYQPLIQWACTKHCQRVNDRKMSN